MLRWIRYAVWLMWWLPTALSHAGEIAVSVDRTTIGEGETFNLVISTEPTGRKSTLDFGALEKDFQILSTSRNSEVTIVNGQSKSSMQWVLTLAPKRSGVLQIPPIQLEGHTSKPITLRVERGQHASRGLTTGKSAQETASSKEVFLKVSGVPEDPYIQSQVIYTVQLFFAVNLLDAALTDPKVSDAVMVRLGDDVSFQSQIDGRSYQVVERKYAISPQKAGELTIDPPVFTGVIDEVDSTFNNFSQFFSHGGKPLRLVAPKLHLRVKPSVSGIKPWIPAKNLRLRQVWSTDPNKLRVGEPVTRTVMLRVVGLTGAQLPTLPPPDIKNVKVYADKPEIKTQFNGDRIVGIRTEKWAFIPNNAGTVQIPALSLSWWSTESNKSEVAILPSEKLQVALGEPEEGTSTKPSEDTTSLAEEGKATQVKLSQISQLGFALAGILLLLWLVTLRKWYKLKKSQTSSVGQAPAEERVSLRQAERAIHDACEHHDPVAAQAALLRWAKLKWPDMRCQHLLQIADFSGSGSLRGLLSALDKAVYSNGNGKERWNGSAFWMVFQLYLKSKPTVLRSNVSDGLPGMTPGSNV